MAFVGQTRMVANAWLISGNTADSNICKQFMQETFDHALKGKKIGLFRVDSGFYTEELLSCMEQEKHRYIMAVKMYPNEKAEVWGLSEWIELTKGIELSEMKFSHEKGKKKRNSTKYIKPLGQSSATF